MRRRTFLSLGAGVLLGTTGCVGESGTGEETHVPSRVTATTAGQSSPVSAAVETLLQGFVQLNVDYTYVAGDVNRQYLALSVAPANGDTESMPETFRLWFDGEWYDPGWVDNYRTLSGRYEEGRGLLLFDLPDAGDATDTRLNWPGGEWRVPESTRRRLSTPTPSLSVSLDAPETVPLDSTTTIPVTVSVSNTGSTDTRFLGALDRSGYLASAPVEQLSMLVPAGDSVTETVDAALVASEPTEEFGRPITFDLDWLTGSTETSVRVVDGA
jgi:hypothetical protein